MMIIAELKVHNRTDRFFFTPAAVHADLVEQSTTTQKIIDIASNLKSTCHVMGFIVHAFLESLCTKVSVEKKLK